MADITFSTSVDITEVIFSAESPRGEKWMGASTHTVPTSVAASYRMAAEEAGLMVQPFP
jgi:hypothetical protein